MDPNDWHPHAERFQAEIATHPVAGLAACLDVDPRLVEPGQPLPPLWHWVALARWPAASTIGRDGHPTTGGFLPATPYPRRMWAGTSVELTRAPVIGAPVAVEQVVDSVVEKTGRQGSFALVTVRTTVDSLDGEPLLVEQTQFAYRPAAAASDAGDSTGSAGSTGPTGPTGSADSANAAPATEGASGADRPQPWLDRRGDGVWRFCPDAVMLMMFSAQTANPHRIHYDVPYARAVEGYPALLVHGPLMAVILAEVARREHPDRQLATISCRAKRPMYLGSRADVRTLDDSGRITADATDLTLGPSADPDPAAAHMSAALTFR